jgi:lysophospholipase L1-like esterase
MAGKLFASLVTLFAVISALFAAKLAFNYYMQLLDVRLDPTHATLFEADNRRLSPTNTTAAKKRLILFGDSRIAKWKSLPGINEYEIVNRGVSGDTSAQAFLRLDRDVLALHPDVVVIQIAVNDLKTIGVFPSRKREIVRLVETNLEMMARRLGERRIRTFLLTILPTGDPGWLRRPVWSSDIALAISQVNRFIRNLGGDTMQIIDCDPVFTSGYRIRPEYALDPVHLNARGYAQLTSLLRDALNSAPHSTASRSE